MNHFYWIYPRKKYHWHSKFSELGKFWRRPFWREYPFPFKIEWLNFQAVWIGTPADQTDASLTRVTKGHITYFFAICNFRAKGYYWHLDWLKWDKSKVGKDHRSPRIPDRVIQTENKHWSVLSLVFYKAIGFILQSLPRPHWCTLSSPFLATCIPSCKICLSMTKIYQNSTFYIS